MGNFSKKTLARVLQVEEVIKSHILLSRGMSVVLYLYMLDLTFDLT